MVEKMYEISMLYDFYGQLLTENQRSILESYYEDNFTLGEIAQEKGISRQGVHDTVRKAEKSLHHYEEKLGLVELFRQREADIERADAAIDAIITEHAADTELVAGLTGVKNILSKLEEE